MDKDPLGNSLFSPSLLQTSIYKMIYLPYKKFIVLPYLSILVLKCHFLKNKLKIRIQRRSGAHKPISQGSLQPLCVPWKPSTVQRDAVAGARKGCSGRRTLPRNVPQLHPAAH